MESSSQPSASLKVSRNHRYFEHGDSSSSLSRPSPQLLDATMQKLWTWQTQNAAVEERTVADGLAGNAITAFLVSEMLRDGSDSPKLGSGTPLPEEQVWRQRAFEVAESLTNDVEARKKRHMTFVYGNTGYFCAKSLGSEHERAKAMENVLLCAENLAGLPCEMFAGKTGILYSIVFLYERFFRGDERLRLKMREIFDMVVQEGRALALHEKMPIPMFWRWHDTGYLGVAHGVTGIVGTLLKVYLNFFSSDEQSARLSDKTDLLAVAEWLRTLRFDSGNFRSSIEKERDELVQICHGAPGFVMFFVRMFQLTGDQKWLSDATIASEAIWKRGLLTKGVGLCHGISGNGLCFLLLYHSTKQEVHLSRALYFLKFAIDNTATLDSQLIGVPDFPFSFLNGIGGLLIFCAAIKRTLQGGGQILMPIWD